MKSIPFYSDLLADGTTNEVLLYGLIEALSFNEGYCWASSEAMAERLGVATGTVKNLLSSISKKGWVEVNVAGNKRVSIKPCLSIAKPKKAVKKAVKKPVEKSKRASLQNDATVTQELRSRHSRMTHVTGVKTGVGDNNSIHIEKEIKEKDEKTQSGLADLKASQPAPCYKQRFREMMEAYSKLADESPEPDVENLNRARAYLVERGIIKPKLEVRK